jgi:hypothetical protein
LLAAGGWSSAVDGDLSGEPLLRCYSAMMVAHLTGLSLARTLA